MKSSNPIGMKFFFQAYTQPYSTKHWKWYLINTKFINSLKLTKPYYTFNY
jgi:hypothetical protein